MVCRKSHLIHWQNVVMKIMDYYTLVLEMAAPWKKVILLLHTAKKKFGERLFESILQAEIVQTANMEFQRIIHLRRSRIIKHLRKFLRMDSETLIALRGASQVKCLFLTLAMV